MQTTNIKRNAVNELVSKADDNSYPWLKYVMAVVAGILPAILQVFDITARAATQTPLLTYGRFVLLILVFQLGIVFLIIFLRDRNRRQLDLRRRIITSYLMAIEQSKLNPNHF